MCGLMWFDIQIERSKMTIIDTVLQSQEFVLDNYNTIGGVNVSPVFIGICWSKYRLFSDCPDTTIEVINGTANYVNRHNYPSLIGAVRGGGGGEKLLSYCETCLLPHQNKGNINHGGLKRRQ